MGLYFYEFALVFIHLCLGHRVCLGSYQGAGMRLWKRILILKLIIRLALLTVFAPTVSWAQALPQGQPEKVSRSVSAALQEGMRSRGFAANDPRFINTIARTSPQLSVVAGGSAAAITVGAVTAPAWVSVAAAIVVGAVVSYAVSLAIDGIVQWVFRPDGKIDERSDAPPVVSGAALVQGGPYWVALVGSPKAYNAYSGDGEALARQAHADDRRRLGMAVNNDYTCRLNSGGDYMMCGQGFASYYKNGAPGNCTSGGMLSQGSCTGFDYLPPPVAPATAVPVPAAVQHIPSADLDKKLNPVIVAALANQAWKQAAEQPGYDGLPYPQNNPITAEDLGPWAKANPEHWPSVRDFVQPNPQTSTNPQPWGLPGSPAAPQITPTPLPNQGTTNPAANSPQVNLGADPAIGAPNLEGVPTAQQIAAPILQLAPDLLGFQASGHEGVCPQPSIDLYGTHVLDAHCKLIEANKPVLKVAMAFAWVAFAAFVVLSA